MSVIGREWHKRERYSGVFCGFCIHFSIQSSIFVQTKKEYAKTMKRLTLLLVVVCSAMSLVAQSVTMQTFTFAHRGEKALYLDVYSSNNKEVQPCLVYIFGGAFLAGQRAEESVVEVYEYFAQRGWKVVAIDYRLGLLPLLKEPNKKRSLLEFRSMLIDAIDMATEDLLEATAFLVSNAESLGIDPSRIVTLGASAGAITALQAEWAICNQQPAATLLPPDFNYAGVVAMAGAICAKGRELEWQREPCPVMLFHGNADRNVPFGTQSLFGVRLFGSESIAESLHKRGTPYWFYEAENMDHNLSWRPMYFLRPEMERFAETMVFGGQRLQIHQKVNDMTLPEAEHDFGLRDYIEANFAPGKPHGVEAATY